MNTNAAFALMFISIIFAVVVLCVAFKTGWYCLLLFILPMIKADKNNGE